MSKPTYDIKNELDNFHSALRYAEKARNEKVDPVIFAVFYGINVIKYLINEIKANCNNKDTDGQNALHKAVIYDKKEIAAFLVQENPNLCIESDLRRQSPLHDAVFRSNLVITEMFLKALSNCNPNLINICDERGSTILHVAVEKSDIPLVNLILKYAPNLIFVHENNQFFSNTPLLLAIREWGVNGSSPNINMCKLLLKFNPKIARDVDKNNRSALNYAVSVQSLEVVKLLSKHDPEVVKVDALITGKADLLEVVFHNGDEEMFEFLLSIHPELLKTTSFETSYDCSVLDLARESTRPKLMFFAKEIEKNNKIFAETTFLRRARIIRQTGHLLGLKGSVTLENENRKKDIYFQGTFSGSFEFSVLLENLLEKYCSQLSSMKPSQSIFDSKTIVEHFSLIAEALKLTTQYLSLDVAPELFVQHLIDNSKNKILILPIGGPGHIFAIGVYKNNLIICDRINQDSSGRLKIYKIAPNKITPNIILKLTTRGTRGRYRQMSCEDLHAIILNEIIGNQQPETVLPIKFQKNHTCALISLKSLIEGLLFVLRKEEFEAQSLSDNLVVVLDIIKQSKDYAEICYKAFSAFIRNDTVNTRIFEIRQVKDKLRESNKTLSHGTSTETEKLIEELKFYEEILMAIIKSHHGQVVPVRCATDMERTLVLRSEKVKLELDRALGIYAELSQDSKLSLLVSLKENKSSELFLNRIIATSSHNIMNQYRMVTTPLVPPHRLIETMHKRGNFIVEAVSELIEGQEAEFRKCIEIQGEGLNKAFFVKPELSAEDSIKVQQKMMAIQQKAADIGQIRYTEYLRNKFSEKSIQIMENFERLANQAMYLATDCARWDLTEFMFKSGYSAISIQEIFKDLNKTERGWGRQLSCAQ